LNNKYEKLKEDYKKILKEINKKLIKNIINKLEQKIKYLCIRRLNVKRIN